MAYLATTHLSDRHNVAASAAATATQGQVQLRLWWLVTVRRIVLIV